MEGLEWCFNSIQFIRDSWLLNDLKSYVKETAPTLWNKMHQGFPLSGIRKLVKDGWLGLPKDFAEWLKVQ